MGKEKVVILGAGAPYRGEEPSALITISKKWKTLDWLVNAFSIVEGVQFHFIGGYQFEKVVTNYPNFSFTLNPHWRNTGCLESLLLAPIGDAETIYVSYSDVVYRPDVVEALSQEKGDVVVVVDSLWRKRYEHRTEGDIQAAEKVLFKKDEFLEAGSSLGVNEANAEFCGLVKFSSDAISKLHSIAADKVLNSNKTGSLPSALMALYEAGLSVRVLDVKRGWAELNSSLDLARFLFGTKAETLRRLQPMVKKSVIDDQVSFKIKEWVSNKAKVISDIQSEFLPDKVVVRSSALSEDCWGGSNAGKFLSILDVPSDNEAVLISAVEDVIESYSDGDSEHHVLIQKMLSNVKIGGVVFTRTLNHGAPYYVVNYDDVTSSTDSVTSGAGKNIKTLITQKSMGLKELGLDTDMHNVISAVKEIEDLVGLDRLDIEFAVTVEGIVHILQLRPIAVDHDIDDLTDSMMIHAIDDARELFHSRQKKSPFLLGDKNYFGVMPDWNPAEIIGPKPRYLAYSLYQYLITDEVWAIQRAEYGYRDVRPHPLLVSFVGHPYVDIRASFNSFIPATLNDRLAEKLIEYYFGLLADNPHFHDKVEFEVLITALCFDFDQQKEKLIKHGFGNSEVDEIRDAIKQITVNALQRGDKDFDQIKLLENKCSRILCSDIHPLDKAFMLLDDVKTHGTLPFSHLARSAFIAIALINSGKSIGILSDEIIADFLNSLSTVTGEFETDGGKVFRGEITWDAYVEKYGFLRPGTYSILSEKYADNPERFLKPMLRDSTVASKDKLFNFQSCKTAGKLKNELGKLDASMTLEVFENFLRKSIEGREYAKFVFTKYLSAALDLICEHGSTLNINKEILSYVSIWDLKDVRSGAGGGDIRGYLLKRSLENKKLFKLTQGVELPPLITKESDFYCFRLPESHPNFITQKHITRECIEIDLSDIKFSELKGRIVLISQADPGFDWLFGYDIAGLITKYGGVNSHMAIRAAELGMPAAIGVGESNYENMCKAVVIDMDCGVRSLQVVR